jgi:phosphoglycerate dehydrogenase-like enzyme
VSSKPRIAVQPDGAAARPASLAELTAAIEEGGGQLVSPDDAEALIWTRWHDPALLAETLAGLPDVRWVQFVTAGVDRMVPALDASRSWTSAKGCYSRPIAEYTVAGLLAGMRSLPTYARERSWQEQSARSLLGADVTIIGGGGIATALTAMLAPFGCTVTVVRRRSGQVPRAARTVQTDRLAEVIPGTAVLIVAAALTPETVGIVDASVLAALPAGAWLVNVARGQHIVTDAIVSALADRHLGGAVLDVTDPEPLPADHPLWAFDNCLITPHVSCPASLSVPYLLARVRDNVERFANSRPLAGIVDVDAGY